MKTFAAVLLFVSATPAMSQTAMATAANPAVSTMRMLWDQMTGYVIKAADQMPEADYAFRPSDATSAGMIKLFGQDQTRLFALMLNATHNAEHYGNIVTYMRMKGMVPPSSQPAPPRP